MRRCPLAISLALMIAATLFLGGCFATYPPVEHTGSVNMPTAPPVASMVATAINYTNIHLGGDAAEYAVNLPAGMPEYSYVQVLNKLGEGAYAMTDSNQWGYHVTEVRVRGVAGEVDVVYSGEDGLFQLVTLDINRPIIGHYEVRSERVWRIAVARPEANYVPTPFTEEELAIMDAETREAEAAAIANDEMATVEVEYEPQVQPVVDRDLDTP